MVGGPGNTSPWTRRSGAVAGGRCDELDPRMAAGQDGLRAVSSLESVEERARDRAELIELVWADPVKCQMSDMLSVKRYGGFERGQACRRDRDVDRSAFVIGSADEAAFAHARQLMVQSALLPPESLSKLNRTELVTVRLGEDGEHRVVGVRQATVSLEVVLDSASQNLLQLVERPPGGLLPIGERSLRAVHAMGAYSIELTHQLTSL